MATFSLGKHPHVELCDLLKLEGWSESGTQAKIAIADGLMARLKRVNAAKLSPGKPLALKAKV